MPEKEDFALRWCALMISILFAGLFFSGCETKYPPPPSKEEAAKNPPPPLPKAGATQTSSDQ
jgi:hypothetical protein